VPETREHGEFAGRRSIGFQPAEIAAYDAALIATDHDTVDYEALVKYSMVVVDTRNACARRQIANDKVVKA
jgi:UDP-N-acetyl-D-glucosamine dehydrogenase